MRSHPKQKLKYMKTPSIKWISRLAFAALIGITSFACSDDDDDNTPAPAPNVITIDEVAANDADLSTFVAVLQATDLTSVVANENANLTVFAPNNAAFADLLTANGVSSLDDLIAAIGIDALTEIVKYHVIGSEVMSSQISDGYVTTEGLNARNEKMSLYINTASGVQINNSSTVTQADIDADNGVIHKVDAVLLPQTVGDLAIAGSMFTSLVTAVSAANISVLQTITDSDLALTMFLPDNDAFADLLVELGVGSLVDVVALLGQDGLTDVLFYHALLDEITSAEVAGAAGTGIATAFANSTIDIAVDGNGGVTITDEKGRTATVEVVDIQGSNGVIHQIDKVLLPL